MKLHPFAMAMRTAVVGSLVVLISLLNPTAAQEPRIDGGEEVLTRGPIHEAFAQPVVFDAQANAVVRKEPPKPIPEMPPEQKPEGDDVEWIGGYWAWDTERADFLWVSGIWRAMPLGLDWTPGYWTRATDGSQWVSGYWVKEDANEVVYLPTPPESLEVGPSSETPGQEFIWVPGTWVWYETNYVWRPGYWTRSRAGWIWSPPYYSPTPSGYVFVDGFWDYSFRRRGLIFAPVSFRPGIYAQPNFMYVPSQVIDLDVVTDHLFVNSRYRQYMFGDYYAGTYFTSGIYPWFAFHMSRYGYDPVYAYYQDYYARTDSQWSTQIRSQYRLLRDQEQFRPALTVNQQSTVIDSIRRNADVQRTVNLTSFALAKPLTEITARKDSRFETVREPARKQAVERMDVLRKATEARATLETRLAAQTQTRQKPEKTERVRSPISRPATGVNRAADRTPPALPEAPKLVPAARPQGKPANRLPQPDTHLEPKLRVPTKPDANPKPDPKPKVDLKPDPKPRIDPRPDPKPTIDPRPKPDPKPNPKPEPKPEPKPKPEPRPDPKPEPKPEPKPDPKPKVEPKPKGDPKPDPKPKPPQ